MTTHKAGRFKGKTKFGYWGESVNPGPNQATVLVSKGDQSAAFAVSASISNSLISVRFGWKRLHPVRNHIRFLVHMR
ncbi:MAG: hypothetical protein IPQ16_00835 [Geobacteraceae bacterium]|nr:hypothetical protein [Geobacteraceae bacterium]